MACESPSLDWKQPDLPTKQISYHLHRDCHSERALAPRNLLFLEGPVHRSFLWGAVGGRGGRDRVAVVNARQMRKEGSYFEWHLVAG